MKLKHYSNKLKPFSSLLLGMLAVAGCGGVVKYLITGKMTNLTILITSMVKRKNIMVLLLIFGLMIKLTVAV